ncbi:hypothetical protein CDAR_128381 [Caerostris darwini]|uniref:Uncharacterized protein n=1 Tax=Caerostris darwini TaxID=1538125 RepID=A0AAV4PFU4_9ARAC|nr:hypothetical protein CDAR_128381 [Caerostris darwini]
MSVQSVFRSPLIHYPEKPPRPTNFLFLLHFISSSFAKRKLRLLPTSPSPLMDGRVSSENYSFLLPLFPPPPYSVTLLSSGEEFPKRKTDARCHNYQIVEDPPHPPEQKKEKRRADTVLRRFSTPAFVPFVSTC